MKINAVALVPAAGVGRRMGASVHKAFVELGDKPMLWHTLNQLNQVSAIEHIVVALHAHDFDYWETNPYLVDGRQQWKPTIAVEGGATRTHSVVAAFEKASSLSEGLFYACVHDAARPYASPDMMQAVIEAAEETGASGCALPVVDTIKQQNDDGQCVTLKRSTLKAMQTPQVIRSDLLQEANHLWLKENCPAQTDDLQLLEPLGVKIALLNGDPKNIKITYQTDI